MAGWNTNPSWNSLASINEGFKFTSISDISPSDFNKLVENMQFLYTNYLNSEGGELDMKRIYPVGSIYLSLEEAFHPAEAFGGSWTRLADRFLIGAGNQYAVGATGGSATHRHASGSLFAQIASNGEGAIRYQEVDTAGVVGGHDRNKIITTTDTLTLSNQNATVNPATAVGGTTAEANTLPPYLAVYMWRRTA